jgi:lysophospholipase L1-like esterase
VSIVRRVFRSSFEQVDRYAADWESANAVARAGTGPLWVVLGDSAAQGVGAPAYDQGWVGIVHRRLGPQWRVVNLSVSGARTRHVVDVQWPTAQELEADLLTAVVGGNDAMHTPLPRWLADVDELVAALPAGAVVSTAPRGVFERKARRVNDHLRAVANERGLLVADIWAHTGPPHRGLYADWIHPNEKGYLQWADAVWAALPASVRPE